MIKCQKCGFENKAGAQFCSNCGAPLKQSGDENVKGQRRHQRWMPSLIAGGVLLLIVLGILVVANKSDLLHTSTNGTAKHASVKISKKNFTKTETLDQLSKGDLADVDLTFYIQDYMSAQATMTHVALAVKNATSHPIRINPQKITVTSGNGNNPGSDYGQEFTVKPGQKLTKQVIANFAPIDIDQGGSWFYSSRKIAKVSDTEKMSDSPELQSANDASRAAASSEERASQANEQSSSTRVSTPQQAINLVKSTVGTSVHGVPVDWGVMSSSSDGMSQDDDGNECYWVRGKSQDDTNMSSYDNLDYYVYPDGTITPRDGN